MRHGIRRRSQLPKSLLLRAKERIELLRCICRLLAVRPEGADYQWRKIPPTRRRVHTKFPRFFRRIGLSF